MKKVFLLSVFPLATFFVVWFASSCGPGGSAPDQTEPIEPAVRSIDYADLDLDGLNTLLELQLGTDPFDADTDDDGLLDGPAGSEDQNGNGKIEPWETDPLNPDTDGDTLPDGLELGLTEPFQGNRWGQTDLKAGNFKPDANPKINTNPLRVDTDGDGIPDGKEDANHNGDVDPGETDPSNPDTDDDGLDDGVEDANQNGKVNPGETDPLLADTDGGGDSDGVEVANGTDPLVTMDDSGQDPDGDGLSNALEDSWGTDRLNADTDGGGDSDGAEVSSGTDPLNYSDDSGQDPDLDGLTNAQETAYGTDGNNPDTDGDGLTDGAEVFSYSTDPLNFDSDGGGDSDGDEIANGTDPLAISDDSGQDPDNDGLTNAQEASIGTDPNNPDTDGDGYTDGEEVANGTDPLVPEPAADIWVGKTAMWQCDTYCEALSVAVSEAQAAGVTVLSSFAGYETGMFYCMACYVCPTEWSNFIKIPANDLSKLPSGWFTVDISTVVSSGGCSSVIIWPPPTCDPFDPWCGGGGIY